MPLSHLKRPLCAAAALYAVVLAFLGAKGFFRVVPPREVMAFTRVPSVTVEARVLSGFSAKRLGDRYWIRFDKTQGRAHRPALAMAYLSRDDPDTAGLRPGHRVLLTGRLRRPRWPRNPGGFDELGFLDRRGAAFVLHARGVDPVGGAPSPRWLPWALGESVHRSMHAYFRRRFPPVDAAILEGVVIGYKGALPSELGRAIQDAGLMHLLTPSGAKVTLVLACALLVCAVLRVPAGRRPFAAAAAGGLYVLIVGPEPPYLRAYLMALSACFGHWSGRASGAFQGLVLSALVLMAFSPRTIFSAGFQLTYLSMLGILIALPGWSPPAGWPWPLRRGLQGLTISFVVQLMLWPAFAAFFGKGSVVGVFANALVVPASCAVMASGFLAWACSGTVPALERAFSFIAGLWVDGFRFLCVLFAGLPGAAVPLRPMSAPAVAAYYLWAFGVLVLPRWRTTVRLWAAATAVGCTAWWLGSGERFRAVFLSAPAPSALVSMPGGRHILVDAGAPPSTLRDAFRALGIRELEAVVLSGPEPRRRKRLEMLPGLIPVGEIRRRTTIPLEISGPGVKIRWERTGAVVSTGDQGNFCIMTASSRTRRRRCPLDREFTTIWEGAVRVESDGEETRIRSQKELHTQGRSVP